MQPVEHVLRARSAMPANVLRTVCATPIARRAGCASRTLTPPDAISAATAWHAKTATTAAIAIAALNATFA